MVRAVTRAYASTHINLGELAIPDNWLNLDIVYENILNTGDAAGTLAMRVRLQEHLTLLPNRTWIEWSPLADDGGPAMLTDKVSEDTGGAHFSLAGSDSPKVEPGETGSVFGLISLPGILQGPAMVDFWEQEGDVEFNIQVWLFEVDSNWFRISHDDNSGSINRHDFDPGFQIREGLTVAPNPRRVQLPQGGLLTIRSTSS